MPGILYLEKRGSKVVVPTILREFYQGAFGQRGRYENLPNMWKLRIVINRTNRTPLTVPLLQRKSGRNYTPG